MAETETKTQTTPLSGNRPQEPQRPPLHMLVDRLGDLDSLDDPAERVAKATRDAAGRGTLKDALSGTWLGHPLHPLLTDVTIGSWISASLLDVIGGRDGRQAADRLVGAGILSALPTAASGLTDWADTTLVDTQVRRIGAVHAIANSTALALYSASLVARRRGRRRAGALLGLAGLGALSIGGQLGGHLSYAKGVGVERTAFEEGPEEWTPVLSADALEDDKPSRVDLGDREAVLVKRGNRVFALDNSCCHRGGPLDEGELDGQTITCPWHGSTFDLSDGSVVSGPATAPQPALEVRVHDGSIEVRAPR